MIVPSPIKYQKLSVHSANVGRYIFTGHRDILDLSTLVNGKGTLDFAK